MPGAPTVAGMAEIFARRGWLSEQPEGVRSAFLGHGRALPVATGDPAFREGDDIGGIFGLVRGAMGAIGSNSRAGPLLGHVLRPGDWFGHGPVLRRQPRTMTFVAVEPSLLWHLDLAALAMLRGVLPDLDRTIGSLAASGADLTMRVLVDALIPAADRRVAATLLRVTAVDEGVSPSDPEGFVLSQAQIGEMANVSRKYVSRILTGFQARGWVRLDYRRIAIRDARALHRLAAGDDNP